MKAVEHVAEHLGNLASYRHCAERIQAAWPDFLTKREQRLEQQRRLGEASEKVAENILEDLFTTVLDWPLADFNNQVEHADIVLTDHGIKRLVVEVKRPGSLAWSRRAVENALAQAMRYASEQKVKAVAVSDGLMLYAADIAEGGLRDRAFVSLCGNDPPLDLWWMGVQGIWRERPFNEGAQLRLLPEEPVETEREAPTTDASECLLHPKYHLPAQCFAYIGDYSKPHSWKLPYLLADGAVDAEAASQGSAGDSEQLPRCQGFRHPRGGDSRCSCTVGEGRSTSRAHAARGVQSRPDLQAACRGA